MKTTEELLRPRVMITQKLPFVMNEVGTLLEPFEDDSFRLVTYNDAIHIFQLERFQKEWSHSFKMLAWWEHRTIEQMRSVKFVKVITYRGYWRVDDIVPVISFELGDAGSTIKPYGYLLKYKHWQPVFELLPSTESEYLKQQGLPPNE